MSVENDEMRVQDVSRMARRMVLLGAVGLLASACAGKGAAFLTIEGRNSDGLLRIPEQANLLKLKVTDPSKGSVLLEKDYPLASGDTFPMTLGVEAGDFDGQEMRVEVAGFLDATQIASADVTVPFDSKELSSFTIVLLAD